MSAGLNTAASRESPSTVTLIGLGPMGEAMTRALVAAGHHVTVWNRTASRAEGVVADGATLAPDPSTALRASSLLILSLTDYRAMYAILGDIADELEGRTIVNLSSESPANTREAAAWAAEHGARLVVGGVMAAAPMIGTPAASVYYSGDQDAFESSRRLLATIGEPHYLGTDPGLAQLMYLAHLEVFLTGLSALLHATALLGSAGLTASAVMPGLLETLVGIGEVVVEGHEPWVQIDSGQYPGDLSTTTMMGASADHVVRASQDAGVDLTLPRAIQEHYRRAISHGHGKDNWTSLIEGLRRPTSPS
ncbi:NAD(P)-dependent oxidoreductase [Agromyces subbeticus]|uniref:NAD(P)-dependent oxidoreductase n=1 Tax=Agromyces subbeticus TaxID=293890 RepID=UPI0003B7AB48|nr:NAD(P)-binding domain-containing protein [Agromyces subbeticus]